MPKQIKFNTGSVLELKKPHPCGGRLFAVLRGGTDVRILCKTCGRDVTVDRLKLEKNIKNVIEDNSNATDGEIENG